MNGTVPEVSPITIEYAADHVVPLPDGVTEWPAMVTVGVLIDSLEVKERVTVLPTLAREVFELFDAIVTGERVGGVLSKVTEDPFVTAVTGVMALPAASVAFIAKVTKPVVSPLCIVYVAV